MAIATNLADKLCEALGVPKNAWSCEFRVVRNAVVTVTVTAPPENIYATPRHETSCASQQQFNAFIDCLLESEHVLVPKAEWDEFRRWQMRTMTILKTGG